MTGAGNGARLGGCEGTADGAVGRGAGDATAGAAAVLAAGTGAPCDGGASSRPADDTRHMLSVKHT